MLHTGSSKIISQSLVSGPPSSQQLHSPEYLIRSLQELSWEVSEFFSVPGLTGQSGLMTILGTPWPLSLWKGLGIMPPCPVRNTNFWTWLLKDCPQWNRMFIPCVYLIEMILKFQWALDSPEVHVKITDPPHLYPPSRKFCLEMIRPRDLYR